MTLSKVRNKLAVSPLTSSHKSQSCAYFTGLGLGVTNYRDMRLKLYVTNYQLSYKTSHYLRQQPESTTPLFPTWCGTI